MTTPTEAAYEYTLNAIKKLNIDNVDITKSNHWDDTYDKEFPEPKHLSRDKWIQVSIYPKNENEKTLTLSMIRDLSELGISFDTGYGFGAIVLDLDWSFTYSAELNNNDELLNKWISIIK